MKPPGRHRAPAPPAYPVPLVWPEAERRYVVVDALSSRNATVAAARYEDIACTGSAKRAPGDVCDPEIARKLATARALKTLAAELEGQARQEVARAEENWVRQQVVGADEDWARQEPVRLSSPQIRERYGEEAAARHDERLRRRTGS